MKTFFTMVSASILATSVFASNCEIKIEGSDMMKYDVAEITLDTSCEQTKISLKHAGKLPINAMGHNVVIVEEKNLSMPFNLLKSGVITKASASKLNLRVTACRWVLRDK